MGRKDSESPPRVRESPRRKSPSRRERSPGRHRSSHHTNSDVADQKPSRNRSSRHMKPRSPESQSTVREKQRRNLSPLREKPSFGSRSPRREKSRSPESLSPSPRTRRSRRVQSEREAPGSLSPSPRTQRSRRVQSEREAPESRSPSPRTKRARRVQSEREDPESRSPSPRTKRSRRVQSESEAPESRSPSPMAKRLRRVQSERETPESRSPSPRTKRLRRVQSEREAEKSTEKDEDKSHGKRGERSMHKERDKERDSDKEMPSDRRERRSRRNGVDNGSSRSGKGHSISPLDNHYRSRRQSRSPPPDSRARDEVNTRGGDQCNVDDDSVSRMKAAEDALEAKEKEKPSFELSGKLAAETNRVRGITLLFTEPPEARKPNIRWRLYVFKGSEPLKEPLYVHRQSCYLFGRERMIADIPTDHPSCSKQHAVLQYRQVEIENNDGTSSKTVKPYLMDLGSTNGTFVNDNRIEPQRYYELLEKDIVKFGNSSREYVLLHENSTG